MTDFVDLLRQGDLPDNAVAVTFDDGYVDNLRMAKPQLERAGIPATVFIASGYVGTATQFWWDELAGRILGHTDDLDCEIAIAGECLHLTLSALPVSARPIPEWEYSRPPRTERESLYLELWRRLHVLPGSEREKVMSSLRTFLRGSHADPGDLPMTEEETRELAAGGLIEIGAHTMTHPFLTALRSDERGREIVGSKSDCERLVGRSVNAFAYPHGAYDDDTREIVRAAGFRFACSTQSSFVKVDHFDPYALPRVHVLDWGAEAFKRSLLGMA